MKHALAVMVCAALSFTASAVRGDGQEDRKTMDGTWLPVAAELAGQKFPDAVLKSMKLIMSDGSYTVHVGDTIDKGTAQVDAAATPKSIDIAGTEGPNKGKTILAIYELSGDTLRVCYDLTGKQRPTEFKTAKDTQQFLVTYKRDKD
jgi:uncharacterized protein (TIGR03067 family)